MKEKLEHTKNLIPNSERTPTERKEIARMGGKKSGESRRKKKSNRELLISLLDAKIQNNKIFEKLQEYGFSGNTYREAISYSMILKAIRGDTKAIEYLLEATNEKENNQFDLNVNLTNSSINQLTLDELRAISKIAKQNETDK